MTVNHQLRIPNEVARLFRGLHPTIKRKVRAALQAIVGAPAGKSLQKELAGLRSYRIIRFRIVYRMAEDRLIEIVVLGPRKYIYAETYRKVRGENQ